MGGTGGADPLDPMTAFLYNEFLIGNLAATGYDYADSGVGRVASANALQIAFWYIEGEVTSLPAGLATTFYNDPKKLAEISEGLGEPMPGLDIRKLDEKDLMARRGW